MSISYYTNIHTHRQTEPLSIRSISIAKEEELQEIQNAPKAFFSLGLHPWHIPSKAEKVQEFLKKTEDMCMHHPNILAIGECGLDKVIKTKLSIQKNIFQKHVELSEALQKPLIIHCVKAYSDLLQIRKESKTHTPWILHGFNADIHTAQQLLKKNCFPSFGGMLMKDNSKAAQCFPGLSPDAYFLETDDSEISIAKIYQRAAERSQITVEQLKEVQYNNFKKIFTASSL